MTDKLLASTQTVPFLLRFAERIPQSARSALRYDPQRQIAQVRVSGQWVDTPDSAIESGHATRKTAVYQETTDDE
ncbi:MAG: hypothetical protein DMG96_31480 [Acidobacteria bacterium]|nr:MAG: hypothetical protein DMG96_31480 [Acidobacteriota bacterium]